MNKKISLGVAVALMVLAATVTFTITTVFSQDRFNSMVFNLSEREAMYNKLAEVDGIVRGNYNGEIDETELTDDLISGYMDGLGDNYAEYISALDVEATQNSNAGVLVGIGIEMKQDSSGYIVVTDVYDDSPAAEAGILVGDLIIQIGEEDVTTIPFSEISDRFAGEIGSTVEVVVRQGTQDVSFVLTRKKIDVQSVRSEVLEGGIGYIKIKGFTDSAWTQFDEAVNSLLSQNVSGIIFDLRNNGGGVIDPTIKMLDKILPEGELMSKTLKDGTTEVMYESDAASVDLPMTILVNEGTASAAELFAAALRDFNKASLVGVNTYGKGVMQQMYMLNDGSAIDFTIAKFNPPSRQNFDGVGLKPDYEVELTPEQLEDLYKLDETNDPQLQKAIEVIQSEIS